LQPAHLKVKGAARQQLELISKQSGRQVECGKIFPGVGKEPESFLFFGISVFFFSFTDLCFVHANAGKFDKVKRK